MHRFRRMAATSLAALMLAALGSPAARAADREGWPDA